MNVRVLAAAVGAAAGGRRRGMASIARFIGTGPARSEAPAAAAPSTGAAESGASSTPSTGAPEPDGAGAPPARRWQRTGS